MGMFKSVVTLGAIAMLLVGLTACDREVTRIESRDVPLGCADCHVSNDLITAKQTQWAESVHGTGEAYARGSSASCAGCHSGSAFQEMVLAGLNPGSVEEGDPEPTRQDCRACHMIHTSYTMGDFALTTEAPVTFYANEDITYSGGAGNLCVSCHQPRRFIPEAVEGIISGISSHWGPHHGPQSAMLLGVGGAGDVNGVPSGHYGGVNDTCVGCHMGENDIHTFEPQLAACKVCHVDATDFDVDGVQSDIAALIDELGERLVDAGLIDENSEDGHPIVSSAPENEAIALWNWLYVAHEDKSLGVHNSDYARALLEEGLAQLPAPPAAPDAR